MTDALLTVRGLRTHFFLDEGTVRAVDGVDLTVRRGKTLGVVGESGCGKSVTAFSILRLVSRPGRIVGGDVTLHRESGSVALTDMDEDGSKIRKVRGAEIAMIFQEPMTSLSPVHTVGNQIVEAVRLHTDLRRKAARARAVELLDHVGIPDPATRFRQYPHEMSGGMRQRAMIAMALSCRPSLLIADEPTTALDVTIQAQIIELMRDLQAESGMSIMLITHDLGVIAEMADEVAVMYLGRVVEFGTTETIFSAPKHPYTRGLMRSIPDLDGPRTDRLEAIDGAVPGPFRRIEGCPFHPRCPEAVAGVCDVGERPTLIAAEDGGEVACVLYSTNSRPQETVDASQG
jgi:peptide/nickel transport system ATP-binding protein